MSVPILYQGSKYKPQPFVPIPVPIAPHFSSAEVGNVNAYTVAITFDSNVLADGSDYSSGVTIKVNGSTRAFESGIRQTNHAIVYYALSTPVVFGDTVTWEYASGSGAIVGETGGMALGDVSAQSVTNNVSIVLPQVASATLLLDLRASQIQGLSDGDPVSIWQDKSGNSNHFTQTGSARPTYRAGGGIPYVEFDGVDDCMDGGDFADNLPSQSIFVSSIARNGVLAGKTYVSDDFGTYIGWTIIDTGNPLYILNDADGGLHSWFQGAIGSANRLIFDQVSFNEIHVYENGVLSDHNLPNGDGSPPVTSIHTTEHVLLGVEGGPGGPGDGGYATMSLKALLIYQITDPVNWPTDRAAIDTWLATNP